MSGFCCRYFLFGFLIVIDSGSLIIFRSLAGIPSKKVWFRETSFNFSLASCSIRWYSFTLALVIPGNNFRTDTTSSRFPDIYDNNLSCQNITSLSPTLTTTDFQVLIISKIEMNSDGSDLIIYIKIELLRNYQDLFIGLIVYEQINN